MYKIAILVYRQKGFKIAKGMAMYIVQWGLANSWVLQGAQLQRGGSVPTGLQNLNINCIKEGFVYYVSCKAVLNKRTLSGF